MFVLFFFNFLLYVAIQNSLLPSIPHPLWLSLRAKWAVLTWLGAIPFLKGKHPVHGRWEDVHTTSPPFQADFEKEALSLSPLPGGIPREVHMGGKKQPGGMTGSPQWQGYGPSCHQVCREQGNAGARGRRWQEESSPCTTFSAGLSYHYYIMQNWRLT